MVSRVGEGGGVETSTKCGQGGCVLGVQVQFTQFTVLVTFSLVYYRTSDCTALCLYDPYMVIADVSLFSCKLSSYFSSQSIILLCVTMQYTKYSKWPCSLTTHAIQNSPTSCE